MEIKNRKFKAIHGTATEKCIINFVNCAERPACAAWNGRRLAHRFRFMRSILWVLGLHFFFASSSSRVCSHFFLFKFAPGKYHYN